MILRSLSAAPLNFCFYWSWICNRFDLKDWSDNPKNYNCHFVLFLNFIFYFVELASFFKLLKCVWQKNQRIFSCNLYRVYKIDEMEFCRWRDWRKDTGFWFLSNCCSFDTIFVDQLTKGEIKKNPFSLGVQNSNASFLSLKKPLILVPLGLYLSFSFLFA